MLYREPFEGADNLEKLFELEDTSEVSARAKWPEVSRRARTKINELLLAF